MSAFEEAIYRVYDRSMMSLLEDDNDDNTTIRTSKMCYLFEKFMIFTGLFYFITLCILHYEFVGNPGCLPVLLNEYRLNMSTNNSSSNSSSSYLLQVIVSFRLTYPKNTNY